MRINSADSSADISDSNVDVCITTCNDINWLKVFVDYLFKNTKDFKLYISDRNSQDKTGEYLIRLKEKYPGIVFYQIADIGECESINWGISQGSSPYVLVTHSGVILPPQWFEKMSGHLWGKIGAVGPVSDTVTGRQNAQYSYGQQQEKANSLSVFCMLLKRLTIEKLGKFYDYPYNGRIIKGFDVSIRLKTLGFELLIDRSVFVKQITSQDDDMSEKPRLIEKYGQAFSETEFIIPSVTVAITFCGDMDHECVSSILSLDKPAGLGAVIYAKTVRTLIAPARNLLVKAAIEHNSQFILFIDDDMVYPQQALMRLLSRACNKDVSIVGGLATKRRPPFEQCIMKWDVDKWAYADVPDVPGLYEIDGIGMAFTLIKTEVFKDLKEPYFYMDDKGLREDLNFCLDAKKAGHRVFVDTSVYLGHLGERIVVDWQLKQQNDRIKNGTFIV